jgi:hypothetical protein
MLDYSIMTLASLGAPPPPVQLATGPVVAQQFDGRLQVFALGGDLWTIWQTASSNGWSGWGSLGAPSVPLGVGLAVAQQFDGRLQVFAGTQSPTGSGFTGDLWTIWQTAPSNGWSGWGNLGGRIMYSNVNPVVARHSSGKLQLFTIDGNNTLQTIYQTAPSNGWSVWDTLEAPSVGLGGYGLAVAQQANGLLQVFATTGSESTGGDIWTIWQTPPSNKWSAWSNLGGSNLGWPAVAQNKNGSLQVFATSYLDKNLRTNWQTAPNSGADGWSGWSNLGGPSSGPPAVIQGADGRLQVFIINANDFNLYNISQTAPNSPSDWDAWPGFNLSGIPVWPIGAGPVASQADGRLQVFAGTPTGPVNLLTTWQTAKNNGWY